MGAMCSCCCSSCCSDCCKGKQQKSSSHTKNLKDSPLKRAKLMKRTKTGHEITQQINTRFITRAQQNQLKGQTYELDVLLSDPYNQFSRVTDHLFLTGIGGLNQENIRENGVKHIVNVTYELPVYNISGIDCTRIPVDDSKDEDLSVYFNEITDKIQKWSKLNENIVVHCMCGVSRSVTIVLAYLMKYEKMPLKESFAFLHKKRDFIRPNNSFFRQLIDFEKTLFKKSSTKLIEKKTEIESKVKTITVPDFAADYSQFTSGLNEDMSLDSSYGGSSIDSLYVITENPEEPIN